MEHEDQSGLTMYRVMLLFFMALYLWVPFGLGGALLALLMDRPLMEGLGVGLLLSALSLALGAMVDEVREDWLKETRAELNAPYEPPDEPKPEDGYYGW